MADAVWRSPSGPVAFLDNEVPLEKEMFDKFLQALLPGLIKLLNGESSEQDLFKCAELLNVVAKAGHTVVYNDVVNYVLNQIRSVGEKILSQVCFIVPSLYSLFSFLFLSRHSSLKTTLKMEFLDQSFLLNRKRLLLQVAFTFCF